MNKLDLNSKDITKDNIEKIAELFPDCVTENEKQELKVDFDKLQEALGDIILDENTREKYEMTWPGKKAAKQEALRRIDKTLRPLKDKSVDFENTKNIYIEGHNVEALKILQETYLGKIKCIYIDPPYNRGEDAIYKDDYSRTAREELEESGELDTDGNKLSANTRADGRFHSLWLSMMFETLKVSRNLLADNGAIFISIDDNELFNLKKICDEIFGEDNFINSISIKMSELSGVKMKSLNKFPKLKESLLIYAKDNSKLNLTIEKKEKSKDSLKQYLRYYSNIIKNPEAEPEEWIICSVTDYLKDNDLKLNDDELFDWKIQNKEALIYRTNSRTVTAYLQKHPDAPSICRFKNDDGNDVIKWDDKEMLFLSKYVDEYVGDIWTDISTINLNKESDVITYEDGQKPLKLIDRVINSICDDTDIVLDFFSGSGTTAHSVIKENARLKKNRNFILVQINENLDENLNSNVGDKKALKDTIKYLDSINKPHYLCEIGEERIRRAAKKIKEETNADIDYGFRVYKVDSSNIKDINKTPSDLLGNMESNALLEAIDSMESNIKEDRTPEDLLTQVILNLGGGVDLSSKIEEKEINGKKVFFVDGTTLIACFDDSVDMSVIEEIAKQSPIKAVFRDSSFGSDSDRINVEETFKAYSAKSGINTEVVVL